MHRPSSQMRESMVRVRRRAIPATLLLAALTASGASMACSAIEGQWYADGRPGAVIRETRRGELAIDMSAFRRPNASGRFLDRYRFEVNFPDDRRHVGELDGRGLIRWSNGTVWVAGDLMGTWRADGRPGARISQSGDRIMIDMSAYGRPTATGRMVGPTAIAVNFGDDRTHTGTLVGPGCIQWSNGTSWTR